MIVKKKSCNGAADHEIWFSCSLPSMTPAAPTCSDECGATMDTVCP